MSQVSSSTSRNARPPGQPRVRDEHVEPAELLDGALDEPAVVVDEGEVAVDLDRAPAGRSNPIGDPCGELRHVAVRDRHRCAQPRELLGHRGPDLVARPRDDRDAPGEGSVTIVVHAASIRAGCTDEIGDARGSSPMWMVRQPVPSARMTAVLCTRMRVGILGETDQSESLSMREGATS